LIGSKIQKERTQKNIVQNGVDMGRKRIKRENLKEGMVVADDVYNISDQMVIPRKTILNARHLAKLASYRIPAVTVEVEENRTDLEKEAVSAVSEETEQMKKQLQKTTVEVKNALDILVKDLNQTKTLETMVLSVNDLLNQMKSGGDVFELLMQMRDDSDLIYQHSLNVALVSVTLGRWLQLPKKDLDVLLVSGLLHDIGKLLIPRNILLKPSKLNDAEFNIMKSHTVQGYRLVKNMDIDERVKYAVLMHHERCNGSGYPMGAHRNKIPPFAKIVAIADVYDAMTSNRSYRHSICPFDVIAKFEVDGLQVFEIEYIMTFLRNIANLYIHNKVQLSDGRVGEVIMNNLNRLSRPVVQVGENYIDLTKESKVKIVEMLKQREE